MPRTECGNVPTRWMLGLGVALAGLGGCRATVGPTDGAVAQAARIDALESQVASLEVRLAETKADLVAARQVAGGDDRTIPVGLPTPERVVEATGSAVRPEASPGGRATLQWRLRPEDVRGRFVQATGPATVIAATLSDDGAAVEVGRWTIEAVDWRESLREGLLGTAYALDLELEGGLPGDAQFLLVRLDLSDTRLESPLRFESSVPVLRPLGGAAR